MPPLTHLVYVSDARGRMTKSVVEEIAERSAHANTQRGVTGVLLYGNRHFMQLLEGELHVVNELFHHIESDPRHQRVRRLVFYPVRRRHFPDWSMKLLNLDEDPRLDRARLGALLDEHSRAPLQASDAFHEQARSLLDEFRRQLLPGLAARDMASRSSRTRGRDRPGPRDASVADIGRST